MMGGGNIGKIMVLTYNDTEEKAIEKIIATLTDSIELGTMHPPPYPLLSFPELEIMQSQRRVLRDRSEIYLIQLGYDTLLYLASYPRQVLSQEQIFEAVWSMESDSCQSSVVNVIYNLRKKIEPDSKKTNLHKDCNRYWYLFIEYGGMLNGTIIW